MHTYPAYFLGMYFQFNFKLIMGKITNWRGTMIVTLQHKVKAMFSMMFIQQIVMAISCAVIILCNSNTVMAVNSEDDWCCIAQGEESACPPEGWWDNPWLGIIVPEFKKCLEGTQDEEEQFRYWWNDMMSHYDCDYDPGEDMIFCSGLTDTFDWDRDNDGQLTTNDIHIFIDQSILCNSTDIIPPDYIGNYQPTRGDIIGWINIFLCNENSGQSDPEPYIVANAAVIEQFNTNFGNMPTGNELGMIMDSPCYGGPGDGFNGECFDMTGDGEYSLEDVMCMFSYEDVYNGGDGSGSSFSNPVGTLGDMFGACSDQFNDNNYCDDIVGMAEGLIGMILLPDDREDLFIRANCSDNDPGFDQNEDLDLEPGEGNVDNHTIMVNLDPPGQGYENNNASDTETMFNFDPSIPCGNTKNTSAIGNPVTNSPVSLVFGHKIEEAVDAVIRLPGRDMEIVRSYTSKPDLYKNWNHNGPVPGLVGANWSLNILQYLEIVPDNQLYLVRYSGSSYRDQVIFRWNENFARWYAGGPVNQNAKMRTLTLKLNDGNEKVYDVWRLEMPGQWTKDYYREGDNTPDKMEGLLLQERDNYGNTWTYYYEDHGYQHKSPRLKTIAINGYYNDISGEEPEAAVFLEWYHTNNSGRLHTLQVARNDNGNYIVTDEVEYKYKNEDDALPDDIGTDGDLIQVNQRTSIDQADDPDVKWQERITQYRYHNGGQASQEDERLNTTGENHQLKLVIEPQQVEYFAQYKNRYGSYALKSVALVRAAEDLVNLQDYEYFIVNQSRVIDLASKIVSYGIFGRPEVVCIQYLQSGCGCSSQSQSIKQIYTYDFYKSGDGAVTSITEYSGSSYTYPERRIIYDTEKIENSDSFYIIQHAIEELNDNGDTVKCWVWHYGYDDDRNLILKATPEAVESYTPYRINGSYDGAACDLNTSSGLIYHYEYQDLNKPDDNRLSKTLISQGTEGVQQIIQEVTYSVESGKEHLPVQINRYSDSNQKMTRWIEYGFHGDPAESSEIAWMRIMDEAETELENGPANTYDNYAVMYDNHLVYERFELFDTNGKNVWSRSADHVLTYREFQQGTGIVCLRTENENRDSINSTNFADIDTSSWDNRWNGPGTALLTIMTRNLRGQLTSMTTPDGVTSYTLREMAENQKLNGIYYYTETNLPPMTDSGTFAGPATRVWYDAHNKEIANSAYTLKAGSTYSYVSLKFDLDTELQRSFNERGITGTIESSQVWHDIDNDLKYTTSYTYDKTGKIARIDHPNGNITEYTRDGLGRIIKTKEGTSLVNLKTTARAYYDVTDYANPEQGVGNGHLCVVIQETGDDNLATGNRTTKMYYDFRGRLTAMQMPSLPHATFEYDNQDRLTERRLVTDINNPNTTTIQLEDHFYSERGNLYRSRMAIDPQNLNLGYLETNLWYDEEGRTIEMWEPSSPALKVMYDEFGRASNTYFTDRGGDADPGTTGNYTDALNVYGDAVLEQYESSFDIDGRLQLESNYQRVHDTADTGILDNTNAIIEYTGYYYDSTGRIRIIADFGTNTNGYNTGSVAPVIDQNNPPVPGDPNNPNRVMGITYNEAGRVTMVTDPEGINSKTFYDDLGRSIIEVENYQNNINITWNGNRWVISNVTDDTNRATSIYYNSVNNIIQSIAHLPDDDIQRTIYDYGVTAGSDGVYTDSLINSKYLLYQVKYHDNSTIQYAWNKQGELRSVIDQNGTLHIYTRDSQGRPVRDDAVILPGSGIDANIQSITVAYDEMGRQKSIESLDEFSSVKNAVELAYSPLGHLDKVYQNAVGSVTYDPGTGQPTGNTRWVHYDFDNQGIGSGGENSQGNYTRMANMFYPDGARYVNNYGINNSISNRISRLEAIKEYNPAMSMNIAYYKYIGLSAIPVVDYMEAAVQLDRTVDDAGIRNYGQYAAPSAYGKYPGWDRFGNLIQQSWVDDDIQEDSQHPGFPTKPHISHEKYGYDKVSNITYAYDSRPGASIANRDFEFEYDDLNRLTAAKRGADDNGSWAYGVDGQVFDLDILNNMQSVGTDLNGDGDFDDEPGGDRFELRSHNLMNQITERDLIRDPNQGQVLNIPFAYDNAGNMTESTLDGGTSKYIYTHDAWNRLVKVEIDTGSQIMQRAEYEYNGLHWRTIKRADTDNSPDNVLDEVRIMYYDSQWRIIEEEIDDIAVDPYNAIPNRRIQYVWGIRGMDDIIMHRIDNDLDGSYTGQFDRKYYHLTDIQFSTVAIIDNNARVIERVVYDAFGKARHQYSGDMDGDGDVDSTDQNIATLAFNKHIWQSDSGYLVEADVNRDGVISGADQSEVINIYGSLPLPAKPRGKITIASMVDNQIGWSGYVYNAETTLYTVRHRNYSPDFGRWIETDPLGYTDSMNMYQNVMGNPIGQIDPTGLSLMSTRKGVIEDQKKVICTHKEICRKYVKKYINGEVSEERHQRNMQWCKEHLADEEAFLAEIDQLIYEAFMEGLDDGIVMAIDNMSKGYLLHEQAEKIREDWGHLDEYQAGDLASKIGAEILHEVLFDKMFGITCFITKGACFEAGTQVETVEGPVNIEDVEAGDYVLSYNTDTSEQSYKEVIQTSVRYSPRLVHLTYKPVVIPSKKDLSQQRPATSQIKGTTRERRSQSASASASDNSRGGSDDDSGGDGGDEEGVSCGGDSDAEPVAANTAIISSVTATITGTPEHPFYLPSENRWQAMAYLAAGDLLLLSNGTYAEVVKVEIETTRPGSAGFKVFNLTVADNHSYYVGGGNDVASGIDCSLLVHNGKGPCGLAIQMLGKAGEEAAGIIKNHKRITSIIYSNKYRIPDVLNRKIIGEVKNVARLAFTRQLKDYYYHAQIKGL